jgi:hypothetical protein
MLTTRSEPGTLRLPVIAEPVALSWARTDYTAHAVDRLLAAPHTNPADAWAAIRRVLHDHAGLRPPHTAAGDAQVLAWLLRHRPGPFTPLLAAITGRDITTVQLEPADGIDYTLTGEESIRLRVLDTAALRGWGRSALLMAGDLLCARVRLRIVPARTGGPDSVPMKRLRAGEPCGTVFPGLVRTGRDAQSWWPAWPPVTASAVLQSPVAEPFGLADEQVTPDLLTWLSLLNR